ncbi:MAG: hypothetical protein RBJ76_27190 [Stenomitos frigidus ULC029]
MVNSSRNGNRLRGRKNFFLAVFQVTCDRFLSIGDRLFCLYEAIAHTIF